MPSLAPSRFLPVFAILAFLCGQSQAADDFPLTEDSKPHDGIPKGQLIKGHHTAKEGSLFPGTQRDYTIYLPPGLDTTKPAPFMVFQDGVIYQAPTVFDNLIARHELPELIGIFITPGIVPAANDKALPRYNRSYEYDSVTDNYASFLIDEFLPAITAQHKLNLSPDPDARAIAGNSSGGIAAFMVAWHRPDAFRRVFTGVGTYVGIHGADQLPVLVRKYQPKPLRVYLQSGENDNNLYCGDWWLANQMMERSLTWNGYEVNHTWGTGGHNAKHATQLFPDALRWLWKGYPSEPVKANPRGDAKWVGGTVVGDGEWEKLGIEFDGDAYSLKSNTDGQLFALASSSKQQRIIAFSTSGVTHSTQTDVENFWGLDIGQTGRPVGSSINSPAGSPRDKCSQFMELSQDRQLRTLGKVEQQWFRSLVVRHDGSIVAYDDKHGLCEVRGSEMKLLSKNDPRQDFIVSMLALAPDQTTLFSHARGLVIHAIRLSGSGMANAAQPYGNLETFGVPRLTVSGMCVDTNGWLYVATSLGIQVLDQAGRVNFILPTPKPPHDVCFGGKNLSDLFIACGDTIYKRPTKAHGYISGQMAPITPPKPKL